MSIVAFLCGLIAFVLSGYITWQGLILGVVALILAVFSMLKYQRKMLPTAGIVLGALGIVAAVSTMMGNPLIHHIISIDIHNL